MSFPYRRRASAIVSLSMTLFGAASARAEDLISFAVLAGSAITNTGSSVIDGNVGVSPGSAITGFPPGIVTPPYAIHQTDGVASLAQSDLTTAYNVLAGRPATADLTGQDLGGQTFAPGVYSFGTTGQLTGTVTLDAHGDPNAVFIFNVGSTLTTASGAAVALINGAQGANVFFRVGSSATLGAATLFAGQIYALTSITLVTGSNIACGAALARNGAVTLDTNRISVCPVVTTPPTGTTNPGQGTGTGTTGGTGGSTGTTAGGTTGTTGTTAPDGTGGSTGTTTTGTPTGIYVTALGPGASDNQRAVGDAIDRFDLGGNNVPLTFQLMRSILTPDELGSSYTRMSGEVATGIGPTGIQAMYSFLSLITDSEAYDDLGPDREAPSSAPIGLRGTVRALGYAEEEQRNSSSPFGALDRDLRGGIPARNPWTVWAAGFGGETDADGNLGRGSHDRSASTYGFGVGASYRVAADTRVGFAIAGGGTDFGLSNGLGSGRSDMIQGAVYARQTFGAAYIMPVFAAAWHDVSTTRDVDIGGTNRLTAAFGAEDIAGEIEAGYRYGWIIPYAAIGVQAFHTPSYTERTAGPMPSIFALSVSEETTITTRTQLGFRVDETLALFDDVAVNLRTRAAWAHDSGTVPRIAVDLVSLPGSGFSVYGAARAADSFLFSAGPEFSFRNGIRVAAAVDGQIAPGFESYYGKALVRYVW